MRYVTSLLTLLAGLWLSSAQAEECVDVNLVLAVDSSKSINFLEWKMQMQGYEEAFLDQEVLDLIAENPCGAIAVTVVRWAGLIHQYTVVEWTLIHDAESAGAFSKTIGSLPYMPLNGTGVYLAIEYSLSLLAKAPYQATKSVIDISGDGNNSPGTRYLTNKPCETAEALFITVNGLPILEKRPDPAVATVIKDDVPMLTTAYETPVDWFYEHNVICGPGAFIVVAYGFEDFARAIKRKLMAELVG